MQNQVEKLKNSQEVTLNLSSASRKFFFSALLFSGSLFADGGQEVAQKTEQKLTPQQIQQQVDRAEHDFQIAQAMFIPYYTGPLITGSANNVPPGHFNVQPYLYGTVNYAAFNGHRKSINTPNTYIINPLIVLQAGLTKWLDFTIIPQGFFKWKQGHHSSQFGDLAVQFGIQLLKQTAYRPSIRLVLGEVFPTGKYQHLDPSKLGLDSSGSGTYITSVGLNVSKVFWWSLLHPVAVRLATNYNVRDIDAHVHSFNSYGGGHQTHGGVRVGNTFNADLGVEVSLTQRWVFATDIAYTCSNKSTFYGNPGFIVPGVPAANGAPSSDQLSLAPAIEYNVSKTGGFIGGVWFSVTGRNSANFASVVLSYTQFF